MSRATVNLSEVIQFINELDGLVERLSTLTELAPLIDELNETRKASLAVRVLSMCGDYLAELSALSDAFTESLPHHRVVEGGRP